MADNGTLHDAFLDELRDAYDAEKQLTKALPKLAKAAASPDLRSAFAAHLEKTRGHVDRLEQVFESLDEKVRGKHCDGIAGIIEEGKSVMGEDFDEATMDACLIAAGQRAEHYEIGAYGTVIAWVQAMGHKQAAALLQKNLDEEGGGRNCRRWLKESISGPRTPLTRATNPRWSARTEINQSCGSRRISCGEPSLTDSPLQQFSSSPHFSSRISR
jgi:ferritin-like metal-binding protein YciE